MLVTKEMLKQVAPQLIRIKTFALFHETLKNIPVDELDQFMNEVIDDLIEEKNNDVTLESVEMLKLIFEMEKEYRKYTNVN